MKRILTLTIALFISGCASPAERRSNPPNIVTSSKKTAKEVAVCIADKWENTKPFLATSSLPVNTSIKLNGYSIMITSTNLFGDTNTTILADVTENQQESITKFYKMPGGGFGNYDQAVKECQ